MTKTIKKISKFNMNENNIRTMFRKLMSMNDAELKSRLKEKHTPKIIKKLIRIIFECFRKELTREW